VHGQQAHLGRPKAGHHQPEQLPQLDQELAVDARPGRPGLFAAGGRRGLFAAGRRDRRRRRREPSALGVVIVVGLARRPPSAVRRRFFDDDRAAVGPAHFQHDRVTDLAPVQQHRRGQHALAHVVPSDDPSVQVFGYDGGHDGGGARVSRDYLLLLLGTVEPVRRRDGRAAQR